MRRGGESPLCGLSTGDEGKNFGRREAGQKAREQQGRSLGASCNEKSFGKPICNRFTRTVTVFLVEARILDPRECSTRRAGLVH
jgi:hypothetical protein